MLKKMRWRFIGAAMAAFSAVILALVCAVNIWNYNIDAQRLDTTLGSLLEPDMRMRHNEPPSGSEEFSVPGPFGGHSREARYMTRFFVVYCDRDGSVTDVNKENIASVSAQDAEEYAMDVLKKNRTSGYYKNYRYLVRETDSGTVIAFLNSEREIQSIKTLLLVSAVIAAVSLMAVFALVMFFSSRIIAPYIRNIETQKQFITDAGHELKTPLTSISASADILAMEQGDNEWVRNIRTQSARLSKLVASLVRLSRLDEDPSPDERIDFSLSDAIWEISEPTAALAAARGRDYSQDIEDGITFTGDRSAIQQMVSALLDNAVKYSDEGGTVKLSVKRRHKRILIEVYNTCVNAADTDLERIFDRFYRSDKSRSGSDSFGIGLSAAKTVAEKHRGTIKAETVDGSGILFRITLPQRQFSG